MINSHAKCDDGGQVGAVSSLQMTGAPGRARQVSR
ncbi:MAG: hypothetical protein JWQ46_2540 [Phenylobacterium sp.]|jgi:hypothetical protein|nr:hypothetical protein [Phenylobacterium sp.]